MIGLRSSRLRLTLPRQRAILSGGAGRPIPLARLMHSTQCVEDQACMARGAISASGGVCVGQNVDRILIWRPFGKIEAARSTAANDLISLCMRDTG